MSPRPITRRPERLAIVQRAWRAGARSAPDVARVAGITVATAVVWTREARRELVIPAARGGAHMPLAGADLVAARLRFGWPRFGRIRDDAVADLRALAWERPRKDGDAQSKG